LGLKGEDMNNLQNIRNLVSELRKEVSRLDILLTECKIPWKEVDSISREIRLISHGLGSLAYFLHEEERVNYL
jgi:hypothetical protein